jgi:hypothetical protein
MSFASCGILVVIFEDQMLMLVVTMKGLFASSFQLVGLISIQDRSSHMSFCWIPFLFHDPNSWVLTEAFPVHLAFQSKELLGV